VTGTGAGTPLRGRAMVTRLLGTGRGRPDPAGRPTVAIIGTRGYPSFYGGFETLVRHLVPFLAARGWDVEVYNREPLPHGCSVPDHVTVLHSAGTDSRTLSTLTHGLSSSVHSAFRRRPDVALVCNPANGLWLPALRLGRVPTAVNVDGIEWERQKWGRAARQMFRLGARCCATFANRLIFDADAIADRWASMFGVTGTVIPYGGTVERPPLPADVDLPDGRYVLYVARFVPENSVLQFLEAARRLATDYRIVVVGSSGYGGPIDESVRALAEKNENVTWLGHVHDDALLHALWSHAGVYFHGHTVGGTNPALVQAMACGAPTVARDTVFNREVLGSAGLFTGSDAGGIAAAVRELMENRGRREAMSAAGLRRVEERYTWPLVCEGYDKVLRALARR